MSSVEHPGASSAALRALPEEAIATPRASSRSEGAIVFLVAAVQLVNVLEFMIVMPLGPDYARDLKIPVDRIGLIGGSYTAAAAVAGLLGGVYLDRFDRRRALALAMAGLVIATAAGALAVGFWTLIAARVLAGMCGGPATSLALSIVADTVPPERRGRAMAVVMGAFSIASVFGVPAGLELARIEPWTWRTPLLAVAAIAAIVTTAALACLPPMRAHLAPGLRTDARFLDVLSRPGVKLSLLAAGTVMIATFAVVPNIPAFLQFNAGYPREQFGLLYLIGGSVSLVAMTIAGRVIDKVGATPAVAVSALLVAADLGLALIGERPRIAPVAFFVLFMAGSSVRNVAMNALVSHVPPAAERARFQSCYSAVQHLAAAIGAVIGTYLLHELPDHRLEGLNHVGALAVVLTLLMPPLVLVLELGVRARARATETR